MLVVHQLACILFDMDSLDTDGLDRAVGIFLIERHLDFALADNRVIELRNLVALRQIGVEIILSVEPRPAIDLRIDRHPGAHRLPQTFAVRHRQHAGHRGIDEADMAVRLGPEAG
jgi:hypothetical protein